MNNTMRPLKQRPHLPQRTQSSQRQQHLQRILMISAIVLALTGIAIWLLSIEGAIQGSWSLICGAVFTVLGVFLTLVQIILQITSSVHSPVPRTRHQQRQLQRLELPLQVAPNEGAIIVYTQQYLVGVAIHLSHDFDSSRLQPIAASGVVERMMDGQAVFVGIFPALVPANYTAYTSSREHIAHVTVYAGCITEVDWRQHA